MVGRRAMNFSFSGSEDQFGHERYYRLDQEAQGEQVKVRSQSKKINKAWLNDHVNDPYVKLALKEGFRSRAAYKLKEMDEINPEFAETDVALVVGANDVVNPAARNDPSAPIYGMPILNVDQAAQVVFLKRSMRPGFAGIENDVLFDPKTSLLFGDAKESLTKVVAAVKNL